MITSCGSNPNVVVISSRRSAEGRRVPPRIRLTIDAEHPTKPPNSSLVSWLIPSSLPCPVVTPQPLLVPCPVVMVDCPHDSL